MSLTASTALTTPFAYASSCANIPFSTTSLVSEFYWADEIITVPFLVSDQADERFSSCQPPGWDSGPGKSSFSFSPAVCPSDWTAYSLSRVSSTLSTAHCCDRYVPLPVEFFFSVPCPSTLVGVWLSYDDAQCHANFKAINL